MSFSALGLRAELLLAVGEQGYTEPTPIQAQAIPAVLAGRDVLGGEHSGNRLCLNRGRFGIALLADGKQKLGAQAECGKRHVLLLVSACRDWLRDASPGR